MQVPRVSICWQYIRANEDKLRSPKMINGPQGQWGRTCVRGCVHGFHGKSSTVNGGYVVVTQRYCTRMPPVVSQ